MQHASTPEGKYYFLYTMTLSREKGNAPCIHCDNFLNLHKQASHRARTRRGIPHWKKDLGMFLSTSALSILFLFPSASPIPFLIPLLSLPVLLFLLSLPFLLPLPCLLSVALLFLLLLDLLEFLPPAGVVGDAVGGMVGGEVGGEVGGAVGGDVGGFVGDNSNLVGGALGCSLGVAMGLALGDRDTVGLYLQWMVTVRK